MKKNIIAIIMTLLAVLTLVGCGKTEVPEKEEETTTVVTEEKEPEKLPEVEKAWYMDEKNYVLWTNENFVNENGVNLFPRLVSFNIPVLEGITISREAATRVAYTEYKTDFETGYVEINVKCTTVDEQQLREGYTNAEKDSDTITLEEIGTFVFTHPIEGNEEPVWEDDILIYDIENMSCMMISIHFNGKNGNELEGRYEFRDNLIAEIRACLQ